MIYIKEASSMQKMTYKKIKGINGQSLNQAIIRHRDSSMKHTGEGLPLIQNQRIPNEQYFLAAESSQEVVCIKPIIK